MIMISNTKVRLRNIGYVLHEIAIHEGISRVDIAKQSGLTKTTISNIVQELIRLKFVEERDKDSDDLLSGRPPIQLCISTEAPLICGMLLKRGETKVLLGTIDGKILHEVSEKFSVSERIDPDELVSFLLRAYKEIYAQANNRILAVGISAVGIIDSEKGLILNPPNYFSYPYELNLFEALRKEIHVPLYLMHDASASVLAEQLYTTEVLPNDFAYVTLQAGIGAGFIINGHIHDGLMGQTGELGHCSINHFGERCVCGNYGCLELYASVDAMRKELRRFPNHPLPQTATFEDFITYARKGDGVVTGILMNFADYVATALIGVVNLFDIDLIVIEYSGAGNEQVLEKMLEQQINSRLLSSSYKHVQVRQSHYGSQLSQVSTLAIITQHLFKGEMIYDRA